MQRSALRRRGYPPARSRPGCRRNRAKPPIFPLIARSSRRIGGPPPRSTGAPPQSARRNASEHAAATAIQDAARDARVRFLRRHGDAVYDALTVRRSRFVRVEELVLRAAGVVPGLVPTAQEIAAEDGSIQRDKSGLEIDQGLFLSAVPGSQPSRRHLRHAMLRPRA